MEIVLFIRNLRDEFANKVSPTRHSVAYKIWARWIITHRSLFTQTGFFLPSDNLETDTQILVEMVDQQLTLAEAKEIYNWLMDQSKQIKPVDDINEISIETSAGRILLSDTNKLLTHTIHSTIYNKLSAKYRENQDQIQNQIQNCQTAIWLCHTLYELLEGKGLQWAVPRPVMYALTEHFNCRTELFASAINHIYPDYYSLFPVERLFGSRGNFFDEDSTAFQEGAFQVNPPFIDPILTELTDRLLNFLSESDKHGRSLTFILIMPDWTDSQSYENLIASQYCTKLIELKRDTHVYYEYESDSQIVARFGTFIFIMSTVPSICTYAAERDIRNGFRFKDSRL